MPALPSFSEAAGHRAQMLPRIFDVFMQTADPTRKTATEIDDDLMVEFFIRWHQFGGGPEEDIMTTFGITKPTYLERLRALAHSDRIYRYPTEIARTLDVYAGRGPSRKTKDRLLDQ